jgi:hypothetical protein
VGNDALTSLMEKTEKIEQFAILICSISFEFFLPNTRNILWFSLKPIFDAKTIFESRGEAWD